MKKSIIDIDYFKELEEQILDDSKWKSDKFYVFDHEAGTGKSRFTQRCIGEMTKTQSHRVLYVQKFKKDNELVNTVERINKYAGREVAGYYCSEIKRRERKQLQQVQVLCITHQLYYQICKGNNLELVKGRDILIIDELPQLVQEIYVTRSDIANLWLKFNRAGGDSGKDLAQILLDMLIEAEKDGDKIKCIDFSSDKYKYLRDLLNRIKNSRDNCSKEDEKLLGKIELLLNQNFFICQGQFISYEKGVKLFNLKNNIILDANGSFDYRYSLGNSFEVVEQKKQFDYSDTELFHYQMKTTKTELKRIKAKLHEEAVNKVDWENTDKVLFVTDIENEQLLEKEIEKQLTAYGDNIDTIQTNYGKKISIDHFGNLIGKNDYRDYDAIVITKTPNYGYSSYVLDYSYLTGNIVDNTEIEPFKNEDIEKLRISILAGEFYQAIKRINRDNNLNANVYIFTDNQDAIEIVRKQLINLQYKSIEIEISDKYNTINRTKGKLNKLKEILLSYKKKGIKEISKKTIREELEIEAPNLSKLLHQAQKFAEENNIIIEKGRKIIFI